MKFADGVLLSIPLTYLLSAVGQHLFDVTVFDALLVASIFASAIVAQALFINPPV